MRLAIVTVSLSRYESHENVMNARYIAKLSKRFLSSSPAVPVARSST